MADLHTRMSEGVTGKITTGVGASFCASHVDHLTGNVHGHSYEVVAWFNAPHEKDARSLQDGLGVLLKSRYDHQTLPPERAWGEKIAAEIGQLLAWCVKVEVNRPIEKIYAVWEAEP